MIHNINNYVDFLMEHSITERQFTLLFLLYTDAYAEKPDGTRRYLSSSTAERSMAKLLQFWNWHKRRGMQAWTEDEIIDLEDKGFITRINKNKLSPDLLKLEEKFIEAIFARENEFEGFWNIYPSHIDNFNNAGGPKIPLKGVDKDELYELYKRKVTTKEEHNKLIRVIRWAKDNQQINMNIRKYLASEQWKEDIKLIKDYQYEQSKYNSSEL